MSVVIETTKGTFTVDLYLDQRPKVCKNFLKLCKVKYYNLNLFHSVQSNFIAQTGSGVNSMDSNVKSGTGESVYKRLYGEQAMYFEGDLAPKIKHSKTGHLSMVNVGDNMFGSQFFITLDNDLDYLDGQGHCVFGEVVEGLEEIVQTFNETICDSENIPYQDIRITHTVIVEDPFEDPKGLEVPPKSPEPSKELLASSRIGADEDLDDYEGLSEEQISEHIAEKEAKAQATILEMIGDLPEADCAPPENVLFVCKLNPVTNDDDLEIIFSRFGKVVQCEVIRDRKSNDSLQYAFVEFEDPKSCEKAYFKMDNVLIDDRRIHVDFSQSVSKYKWKGKGRLEIVNQDNQDSSKMKAAKKNYEPNRRKFDNNARSRSRSPRIQRSPKRQRSTSRDRKRQRSRSPKDHKIIPKDNYKKNDRRQSRSRSPRDHKIISKDNYKKKDSRRSRSRSPKDHKSYNKSSSKQDNYNRNDRRQSRSRSPKDHKVSKEKHRHERKRSRSRSKDRHYSHKSKNKSRDRSRDRHHHRR